jgi:hypothetical protein
MQTLIGLVDLVDEPHHCSQCQSDDDDDNHHPPDCEPHAEQPHGFELLAILIPTPPLIAYR